MTPQMQSALSARQILLAGLLRITMPGYTLRLCDGAGVVTWGADMFSGRDARFGTIGEVESLTEQVGDSIPGLEISLLPPSTSAAIDLSATALQGSPVRLWLAVVDPATGTVMPDPELMFAGEVDQTVLEIDRGSRTLSMSIASAWERLFEPNEGANLSDSFHRSIWPNETGFANMAGTPITRLWGPGEKPPVASFVASFPITGVQRYF